MMIGLISVIGGLFFWDLLEERLNLDQAEAFGLGMLITLAALGLGAWLGLTATGNTSYGFIFTGIVVGAVGNKVLRTRARFMPKFGKISPIWLLTFGILLLFPIAKSLAPSDMNDWDTMAYHFAVSKIWLLDKTPTYLPYIHQSNFPWLIDSLFTVGLGNGEASAKFVTVLYLVAGMLMVYGMARRKFGAESAPWCTLLFTSCPLILWSSGSGYIDVAHGIFAGFGILYAVEAVAEERYGQLILAGILLGCAAASKYTGLQTMIAALLVVGFMLTRAKAWKPAMKPLAIAGLIAILIPMPWFVRNIQNTGNPVFPFFYKQLGGKNWDSWRAEVYADEQQSFGVGRNGAKRDPLAIGAGVLGLSYQPGRYINPAQDKGGGVPMGAIGITLLAPLAAALLTRRDRFVDGTLAACGIGLFMWFFLSQQVRYLSDFLPIFAVLAGAALYRDRLKMAGFVLTGLQAGYTMWMLNLAQLQAELPVLLGKVSRDEAQKAWVPFAEAAPDVNEQVGKDGRVALYDEVFGYFLDVPYFWANPGHSTIIPYETLNSGSDYAARMKELGFTHIYLSMDNKTQDRREMIAKVLGGKPLSPEEKQILDADLRTKWLRLLLDAVSEGSVKPVKGWNRGVLFELMR